MSEPIMQHVPEIEMRLRVDGIEVDGSLKACSGFVGPPLAVVQIPQIDKGGDVVPIQ
jgi:hypothetical protein